MPNPPIPTNPAPLPMVTIFEPNPNSNSAGDITFATDNDEDCVMHFWAGFAVGVCCTFACAAIFMFT